MKIVYGPVASWRLGRSLGVDLICSPEKICSFDCIYCQLERTDSLRIKRVHFYSLSDIYNAIYQKRYAVRKQGKKIDFIIFLLDRESILKLNLGREIDFLHYLGINISIITQIPNCYSEKVLVMIWQKQIEFP